VLGCCSIQALYTSETKGEENRMALEARLFLVEELETIGQRLSHSLTHHHYVEYDLFRNAESWYMT
jgi:hypothetical protein